MRALLVVFKFMRDDKYEGVSDCRARYVKIAILKLMHRKPVELAKSRN